MRRRVLIPRPLVNTEGASAERSLFENLANLAARIEQREIRRDEFALLLRVGDGEEFIGHAERAENRDAVGPGFVARDRRARRADVEIHRLVDLRSEERIALVRERLAGRYVVARLHFFDVDRVI